MSGTVRVGVGHGKLLLFGEHAAVYGHPACGITLPNKTQVEITDTGLDEWRIHEQDGENRQILTAFLKEIENVFEAERLRPGEIRVKSDIPQGLGFGSSAAWCVAFAKAILENRTPRDELWLAAHRSETFFHGTPSGIDTGLSLLGGLYAFRTAPPELPRARLLPGIALHLIAGAVSRQASTRTLVADLRRRIASSEREAVDLVKRLGSLAGAAIDRLDSGSSRPAELGRLANQAQEMLARLGLSTPALDRIIAAGTAEGALGGKLSGAGGGGAFFLIFDTPERADEALAHLADRFLTPDTPETVTLFRYSRLP